MKVKKYTMEELRNKYWEFQKVQATHIETSGGGFSGGCGYSRTYLVYTNTIEGFLLWLEQFNKKDQV